MDITISESLIDNMRIDEMAGMSENKEYIPTPEDIAFNNELLELDKELQELAKKRNNLIDIIRNKIQAYVKNADDALSYLSKYIELTVWFHIMQIDTDNNDIICNFSSTDEFEEILGLCSDLCSKYFEINIEKSGVSDSGCWITLNKK